MDANQSVTIDVIYRAEVPALPVLVPPVRIQASVDSATLTIPLRKTRRSLGCKTKSLAPPVTSIMSLGRGRFQISVRRCKMSDSGVSWATRIY